MRSAYSFLLVILLATVVASTATTADKPVHEQGPISFQEKRSGLWFPLVANPQHVDLHRRGANMFGRPKPQDVSEMRPSKLCLNVGPCFKKRLVCPKKCKVGGRLEDIHALPRCIFDCHKCVAYC